MDLSKEYPEFMHPFLQTMLDVGNPDGSKLEDYLHRTQQEMDRNGDPYPEDRPDKRGIIRTKRGLPSYPIKNLTALYERLETLTPTGFFQQINKLTNTIPKTADEEPDPYEQFRPYPTPADPPKGNAPEPLPENTTNDFAHFFKTNQTIIIMAAAIVFTVIMVAGLSATLGACLTRRRQQKPPSYSRSTRYHRNRDNIDAEETCLSHEI